MCIAALDPSAQASPDIYPDNLVRLFSHTPEETKEKPVQEELIGSVRTDFDIAPGSIVSSHFIISWYFPNLKIDESIKDSGRYYQNRFTSAFDVAQYIQNISNNCLLKLYYGLRHGKIPHYPTGFWNEPL